MRASLRRDFDLVFEELHLHQEGANENEPLQQKHALPVRTLTEAAFN